MASYPDDHFQSEVLPLPQCGFGADVHFKDLIKDNRFLYRVYTPKERSPFFDETDPIFVAPKFNEVYARSPLEVSNCRLPGPQGGTYADAARHMDWTTRSSSVYVSTSFSFAWSIWEALRRYHFGVKKDVQIAIIDTMAVADRAETAVELLRKSLPTERRSEHWRWYRGSQESQSVFVYGFVPANAVLASVPLLSILAKLPSYFLQSEIPIKENPLRHIAWDYAERKPSYRQFCQDMSSRFLNRPNELRLRDATGGAVRLALAFLRPWFHELVTENLDSAIDTLHILSFTIAQWPGQWWVREHPELQHIIQSINLAIGEELRVKYEQKAQTKVLQLQEVIEGLEKIIRGHERTRINRTRMRVHWEGETTQPIVSEPYPLARTRPAPLEFCGELPPQSPIHFETPITPPDSPRHSLIIPSNPMPHRYVTVPLAVSFQPLTPPADVSQAEHVSTAGSSAASSPSPSRPGTPQSLTSQQISQHSPPPSPIRANPSHDEDNLVEDEVVVSDPLSQPFVGLIPLIAPAVSSPLDLPLAPSNIVTEWPFSPKVDTPLTILVPPIALEPSPTSKGIFPISPAESSTEPSLPSVFPSPVSEGASPNEASPITRSTSSASFSTLSSKGLSPIVVPTSPSTDQASKQSSASPSLPSTPSSSSSAFQIISLPPVPVTPSQPSSPIHERMVPPMSSELIRRLPAFGPQVGPSAGVRVTAHDLFLPPRSTVGLIRETHHLHEALEDEDEDEFRHSPVLVETASFIVTGFLVGAFITLFLVSTQRRTLLYLT